MIAMAIISSLRRSLWFKAKRWSTVSLLNDRALVRASPVTPVLISLFFFSPPLQFFLNGCPANLSHNNNRSIIAFLLGQTIQGNLQSSGYVLSLPAVGPILPPSIGNQGGAEEPKEQGHL